MGASVKCKIIGESEVYLRNNLRVSVEYWGNYQGQESDLFNAGS